MCVCVLFAIRIFFLNKMLFTNHGFMGAGVSALPVGHVLLCMFCSQQFHIKTSETILICVDLVVVNRKKKKKENVNATQQ